MRGTRFALAARTAGILLIGLALTLPAARHAHASTASEAAAGHILLPSAGWNGRPIEAPHRHETVRTAAADAPLRGWSAGPVRLGAGFHRAGGSDRVRELQRLLARLGYRVGPIDGLFGRRTRAAVGWFQVKHGLPVNGRATLVTVRHLRARTGARATTTERAVDLQGGVGTNQLSATSRAPAWEAFRQLVGSRAPVPGGRGDGPPARSIDRVLIALLAVDALLLIALLLQRRSRAASTGASAPVPAGWHRPPAAEAEREGRPARRFAPPVPRPEERSPGSVPARSHEGRS
jgi:peptidoglycan hydrolase-like protein with peptidoglycan-binding domain